MTSESGQVLVVLSSTEWRNLLVRKRIRLAARRALQVSTPPSQKEMNRLFTISPFTKVGSSIDVLVLQLKPAWRNKKNQHLLASADVNWLNLDDVISHHCAARHDVDYYQNIASKYRATITDSIFENFWSSWTLHETLSDIEATSAQLLKCLSPSMEFPQKRKDHYKWTDVARLCLRPKEVVKEKPAHIDTFLKSLRSITDATMSVIDSEQLFIAANIEWIDARLGKDPMKTKKQKQFLQGALNDCKDKLFSSPGSTSAEILNYFHETYKRAYTDELTPTAIAVLVHLHHASSTKSKELPEKVVRSIRALVQDEQTLPLASMLLTASLGVEFAHQLVDAMSSVDFQEIAWDNPEN
jgi:hypothetical protein